MKIKNQLILLVDETTPVENIKKANLSGYERVDLLYWSGFSQMMKDYSDLANPKFYLHSVQFEVQHHINQFALKDYSYYVVSQSLNGIEKFPEAINNYMDGGKTFPLLMIKPVSDSDFDGLVVNSFLQDYLCGFGDQTIMEKIEIFAKNNNLEKQIFSSLEDFYAATN